MGAVPVAIPEADHTWSPFLPFTIPHKCKEQHLLNISTMYVHYSIVWTPPSISIYQHTQRGAYINLTKSDSIIQIYIYIYYVCTYNSNIEHTMFDPSSGVCLMLPLVELFTSTDKLVPRLFGQVSHISQWCCLRRTSSVTICHPASL